jgi:phosphotransferase system enzyme I (PtsI)
VLVGLGLDEFSMAASAIPAAKAVIRQLSAGEAKALAQETLAQPEVREVRALVERWMEGRGI